MREYRFKEYHNTIAYIGAIAVTEPYMRFIQFYKPYNDITDSRYIQVKKQEAINKDVCIGKVYYSNDELVFVKQLQYMSNLRTVEYTTYKLLNDMIELYNNTISLDRFIQDYKLYDVNIENNVLKELYTKCIPHIEDVSVNISNDLYKELVTQGYIINNTLSGAIDQLKLYI